MALSPDFVDGRFVQDDTLDILHTPRMKFGYTILYVNDVNETIGFYERAFGLIRCFVTPTGEYGEMTTGETKLAFAKVEFVKTLTSVPFETAASNKPAPPVEIGLVTEAVQESFDRAINAGAVSVKPPEKKPWGQLVGYVRDNNGFLVEICSPML